MSLSRFRSILTTVSGSRRLIIKSANGDKVIIKNGKVTSHKGEKN